MGPDERFKDYFDNAGDRYRPTPGSLDRVHERVRRRRNWRSGLSAMALVLIGVGSIVLLRFGPSRPLATAPPTTTTTVATTSTASGPTDVVVTTAPITPDNYIIPTYVPSGLTLTSVDTLQWESRQLVYTGAERTLVITTNQLAASTEPFPDGLEQLLAAAFPDATVAQEQINGQPSVTISRPRSDGWTIGIVVERTPDWLTIIQARGLTIDEVAKVASGLDPSLKATYAAWETDSLNWDIQIRVPAGDVDTVLNVVEDLPAVASTTSVVLPVNSWSDLILAVDDTFPTAFASPERADPMGILLGLDADADLKTVSESLRSLAGPGEIPDVRFSPPTLREVAQGFLDSIVSTATLVHSDPTVYQASAGPEPQFDPSSLGTEQPLDPHVEVTEQLIDDLLLDFFTEVDWTGPFIDIGALDDGARLVLMFNEDLDYGLVQLDPKGGGAGILGPLAIYSYGIALTSSGTLNSDLGGVVTYAATWVPPETSIVVLELGDGTRLWQRPIAGYGLFRVLGPGYRMPSSTVIALDVDGNEIGRWDTP